MNLLPRRPSSLQAEQQAEVVKKGLLSESYLRVEEKLARFFEAQKLGRAQRRAGIRLYREGVLAEKMTLGRFIKQFLPPPGVLGMDGAFYNDLRTPFIGADPAVAITLAATDKALYSASLFPVLSGQYFSMIGKRLKIKLFGKITTAVTPGNGTFDIYYGTGADANGTILASSAALALTASQTNLSWMAEVEVVCVTTGSAGTLFCTGIAFFNNAVLANTLQPMLIPASAAVVSGAVDLTAANIISVQFKRSGSTVETMTVQQMTVIALN